MKYTRLILTLFISVLAASCTTVTENINPDGDFEVKSRSNNMDTDTDAWTDIGNWSQDSLKQFVKDYVSRPRATIHAGYISQHFTNSCMIYPLHTVTEVISAEIRMLPPSLEWDWWTAAPYWKPCTDSKPTDEHADAIGDFNWGTGKVKITLESQGVWGSSPNKPKPVSPDNGFHTVRFTTHTPFDKEAAREGKLRGTIPYFDTSGILRNDHNRFLKDLSNSRLYTEYSYILTHYLMKGSIENNPEKILINSRDLCENQGGGVWHNENQTCIRKTVFKIEIPDIFKFYEEHPNVPLPDQFKDTYSGFDTRKLLPLFGKDEIITIKSKSTSDKYNGS